MSSLIKIQVCLFRGLSPIRLHTKLYSKMASARYSLLQRAYSNKTKKKLVYKESQKLTILELLEREGKGTFHSNVQDERVLTVDVLSEGVTEDDYLRAKTELAVKKGCDDAFYVMNINKLVNRYKLLREKLPNIKPFYAVKSNNDSHFLSLLANIGTGFDCASKREIEQVLELGVSPHDIIFAHPCKQLSHIRFAREKGVSMMTFDSKEELYKIASEYKEAKLLVRIKCDDLTSMGPLGAKFGTTIPEACQLVDLAKTLNLNIIGTCFHVGFGMKSPHILSNAIEMCHTVFEYAASVGTHMTMLDIGGGYPGLDKDLSIFNEATIAINSSIERLFANKSDLTVIAEPGQYFSNPCFTLVVQVTSKIYNTQNDKLSYFVNDGIYGSMLSWKFMPEMYIAPKSLKQGPLHPCIVWGPTADSDDKICDTELPLLNVGDCIVFNEMGGYTLSIHSEFNGYCKPKVYWYINNDSIFEEQ